MKDKKKVVVLIISLILLLIIGKYGYGYLSGTYMPIDSSTSLVDLKAATDFTVYNEEGKAVKLSDFKGKKPVVVNIWASWCGPCQVEMPYFEEAIKKYGDEVEILMVNLTDNQRETKESALEFIKDKDLEMDIVFDEDLSAANAFNVMGIPRTIFINIDGEITFDREGLVDEDMLFSNIKKIIK